MATTGAVTSVALAGALKEFWYNRGYWQEGRHWLTAALSDPAATVTNQQTATQPVRQRARTLLALAQLAQHQGNYALALQWVDERIARYCQAQDGWGEAEALRDSGWKTAMSPPKVG